MIAVCEPNLTARTEPEKPVTSKSDTVNEPFDFNLLIINTIEVGSQKNLKKMTLSSAAAEAENHETDEMQLNIVKKEISFGIELSALQKEGEKEAVGNAED